jgi:hypothetical protein
VANRSSGTRHVIESSMTDTSEATEALLAQVDEAMAPVPTDTLT